MATLVSWWLVGFGDMQEFWIKQITLYLLYFDFLTAGLQPAAALGTGFVVSCESFKIRWDQQPFQPFENALMSTAVQF